MSHLPANLRLLRTNRGLSRQQLADLTGLTKSSVAVYESGRWPAPEDKVALLAAFFDRQPAELLHVDLSQTVGVIDMRARIADNIKYLRETHHWSQRDLERESGIPRTTIAQWETATAKPTAPLLKKLARTLRISPDDLTRYDLRPAPPADPRDTLIATQARMIKMLEDENRRLRSKSRLKVRP